ncbi:MAG: tRNA 2-thiouridine(34) synthase MnmA [Patescibacteria group bacterium]
MKRGKQNKGKVFVGLSGGVDSSVSAALLKAATPNNFQKSFGRPTPKGFRGYDVTGVFIKVWQPASLSLGGPDFISCNSKEDRLDAMRVAAHLGIPFRTLNLEKEYKKGVVDYMLNEYRKGNTPNPDVMCNKKVKFGAFLKYAMKEGADFVATGHYARVAVGDRRLTQKKSTNRYKLLTGVDKEKDQSYFLWTLKQEQLKHILFPVGAFQKGHVRELAQKSGLITATKKDSQGLCFVGKINMKEFLKHYIKEKIGNVVNEKGIIIGRHNGAFFYTIGERHGFSVTQKTSSDRPYYVIAKNINKNLLVVSNVPPKTPENIKNKIFLENFSFVGQPPKNKERLSVRFRYRETLLPCQIHLVKGKEIELLLDKDAGAVTSGQSAVLYRKEECVGGGIIS